MIPKVKLLIFLLIIGLVIGFLSCNPEPEGYKISITNPSEHGRFSETVEVPLDQLPEFSLINKTEIVLKSDSGEPVLTQFVDLDADSIPDHLLLQTDLGGNETKTFTLFTGDYTGPDSKDSLRTYCRFVPERIDDFAWENDRVAFRTYGPKCQQMYEEGIPGGLISSGIDCWLKRVDYPIIDKWYKKNEQGESYHIDDGEGLDNYHVGTTRGCGGTAIVHKENYVLSENFLKWKIIANGPIRSVFELEYPPYTVGGVQLTERKTFSIDLGSNFYRCDVKYDVNQPVEQAAVGIAHHSSVGNVTFEKEKGFLTYWESLDDSFLGSAIIVHPASLLNDEVIQMKDNGNNWVHLQPRENAYSFWAGFGWKKAGRFTSPGQWNQYVLVQSIIKNTPVKIRVEKF